MCKIHRWYFGGSLWKSVHQHSHWQVLFSLDKGGQWIWSWFIKHHIYVRFWHHSKSFLNILNKYLAYILNLLLCTQFHQPKKSRYETNASIHIILIINTVTKVNKEMNIFRCNNIHTEAKNLVIIQNLEDNVYHLITCYPSSIYHSLY